MIHVCLSRWDYDDYDDDKLCDEAGNPQQAAVWRQITEPMETPWISPHKHTQTLSDLVIYTLSGSQAK